MTVEVGTFTVTPADGASYTLNLRNPSLTPTAILLWGSGQALPDVVDTVRDVFSFGAADNQNGKCCIGGTVDAVVGLPNPQHWHSVNYCYLVGSSTAQTFGLNVSSFNAGNVVFDVGVQDSQDQLIAYMVIQCTSAKVVTQLMGASLGNESVTGVGFQPSTLITIARAIPELSENRDGDMIHALGFASAVGERWAISGSLNKNGGQPDHASRYASASNVYLFQGRASLPLQVAADLASFDADGFTLNFNVVNISARYISFLCLDGIDSKVYTQAQRTTVGQSVSPSLGFAPQAVMSLGHRSSALDAGIDVKGLTLGAANSVAHQGTLFTTSLVQTGPSRTVTARELASGFFVGSDNGLGTHIAEAELVSLNADDITINWRLVDATARINGYLAFGPSVVPPAGAVMNQLQGPNVGADLYNGTLQ